MKKLIVLAVVILGFAATTFAQSVATAWASASATILPSVGIYNDRGIQFGSIYSSLAGSDITVAPKALDGLTGTNNVVFDGGTHSSARFQIWACGDGNPKVVATLFTAELDHKTYLYCATNGQKMEITDLKLAYDGDLPVPANGVVPVFMGLQTVYLGATLHMKPMQLAGVYFNPIPALLTISY